MHGFSIILCYLFYVHLIVFATYLAMGGWWGYGRRVIEGWVVGRLVVGFKS